MIPIDTIKVVQDSTVIDVRGATSDVIEVGHNIILSPEAEESTYYVASLLMKLVNWVLNLFTIPGDDSARKALYAFIVLLIAFAVGMIAQWVIGIVMKRIPYHYKGHFVISLEAEKFFTKISRIISPLMFLILIQVMYHPSDQLYLLLTKCTWIYIVIVAAIALVAFVSGLYKNFDVTRNKRNLPLRGIAQVVKAVVWILSTIVIVSIIVDRSPVTLIAGLSAFAAVIMLVFKDSILGMVAGVQLSDNDTLREGDWIKVDGTTANGTVKEVSLISVKVLNWDNTITTLPPYSLITGSFQNFRHMKNHHRRRICRCYYIDADSIKFADDEMLQSVSKLRGMEQYIKDNKQKDINDKAEPEVTVEPPIGTIETNLGLLRAYLTMYLRENPMIEHRDIGNNLCFVNTLEQTPNGVPLQVYCFTATSDWVEYEAIQSEIFEHIAAVLPYFQLYTFENPSGRDTVNEGYLEAGGNPDDLFGLPYPFRKRGSNV